MQAQAARVAMVASLVVVEEVEAAAHPRAAIVARVAMATATFGTGDPCDTH